MKTSMSTLRRALTGAAFALGLVASAHAQTTLLSTAFTGGLGSFTSAGSVVTGTYGARLRGALTGADGAITSPAISTVGHTSVSVSFTRSTSGLDSGEAGIAEYSVNGTTYTAVESLQSVSGATTVTLPSNAAGQSALRLRFRVNASSSLETYTVTGLTVTGNSGTSEPPPTGGGTLPPVTSVDADGPFAVTVTQSTGPSRQAWVVRPTTLGANGLKHPIFIWGPGAGTGPSNYEFHLRRIASHGFVVYSITSTGDGTEMKAGLDWLIQQNSSSTSALNGKLDTTKIAAGGHSRGSVSTFAFAGDSRLTTTIHVAGGSFDGNGPNSLRKPAAYICGEADTLATPNCERDYTNTRVPVYFTVMNDVDHVSAAREGIGAIVAWLRWHLAGETSRRTSFLDPGQAFTTGKFVSKDKNF